MLNDILDESSVFRQNCLFVDANDHAKPMSRGSRSSRLESTRLGETIARRSGHDSSARSRCSRPKTRYLAGRTPSTGVSGRRVHRRERRGRRRQTKEARSHNDQAVSPVARHRQRSALSARQADSGLVLENRPSPFGSAGARADSPLPRMLDEEPATRRGECNRIFSACGAMNHSQGKLGRGHPQSPR